MNNPRADQSGIAEAISTTWRQPAFFRVLLVLAATVVVLVGIRLAAPVLNPILFAVVLSLLFSPLYAWLKRYGVPTPLALVIMLVGLTFLFVVIFYVLVASIYRFSAGIGYYAAELNEQLANVLVYLQILVPGVAPEDPWYAFEVLRRVVALHEVGRRERSRVDHRIVRAVIALVEDDGVERVAARLYPDSLENVVASVSLQSHTVDEHLGDGLEGERSVVVSNAKEFAICGSEADGEPFVLGVRDLRFVIATTRGVIADDFVFVQR